jgi:CBS domain-containing protein
MQVMDLATRNVVSCRADDPLSRAAQLMWDHDIGCVPVVDDRGGVIGMVTDRDIAMAALTQGRALADIPTAIAMARNVVWCTPREEVRCVEQRMAAHQVRRVPVVDDDGDLVGILSLADLARVRDRDAAVALLADIAAPRGAPAAAAPAMPAPQPPALSPRLASGTCPPPLATTQALPVDRHP